MIGDCFCSCFPHAASRNVLKDVHIYAIIEGIKKGRWKDKIETYRHLLAEDKKKADNFKKTLPCVTFSGTFKEYRKDANLEQYSRVIVIDLDKIPPKKFNIIRNDIQSSEYVLACFESPTSGRLKVLLLSAKDEKLHKQVFFELENFFKLQFGLEVDTSGKNVSRLCFVSYDPNIYFNEDAREFGEWIEEYDHGFETVRTETPNLTASNNATYIFELCDKRVRDSRVGNYSKGNRNNFIYALACHLNRTGMHESQAIMMAYNRYPSLGYAEVKRTVESGYKYNKKEFGTRPVLEKRRSNQLF
jgi:hypothetical protein